MPKPMLTIAALYHFTRFADPAALKGPLAKVCCSNGVRGSLLLAPEGINGTIAGPRAGIDAVLAHIRALPGRKIVYTNGCAPYAERVIAARGLSGLFDAVYGVEHAGFLPKPEAAAFTAIFTADGLDTARAAMFEDDPRNLAAPHAMGMRTVHVAPDPHEADHIHHHTDDLTGFLARLL
jgi:FMN phosphatase YigB (HAD superfamily)